MLGGCDGRLFESQCCPKHREVEGCVPSRALLAVLHVLEQNIEDGPSLCRPGGFAGRLAGQGWNRMVEPIRVVASLELERKLLRFIWERLDCLVAFRERRLVREGVCVLPCPVADPVSASGLDTLA